MDFGVILEWASGLWSWMPMVLMIVGSVVVAAQVYIFMTPSKDDDAWYAKVEAIPILGDLLKALSKFAVIQRK